jgi:hypothetical protein
MFLPSPVEVSGKVTNVSTGEVRLQAKIADGQPLGLPPVLATTAPVTDGLAFNGTLQLGYAPTPRNLLLAAEYLGADGRVQGATQQQVSVIGRFGQLQYIAVEAPLPLTRDGDPTITVRGAAPGPPKAVLVRLLNAQDQVLDEATAQLGWYQSGLPCDFLATVRNLPEGTTIQVLSLGDDGNVLEQDRVQLGQHP